jgi:hypothetical protein
MSWLTQLLRCKVLAQYTGVVAFERKCSRTVDMDALHHIFVNELARVVAQGLAKQRS